MNAQTHAIVIKSETSITAEIPLIASGLAHCYEGRNVLTGVVLSIACIVWRWRRLVRSVQVVGGLRASTVASVWQHASMLRDTRPDARGPRWEWLSCPPDLRRIGPDHPVQSLRIALGGTFMPQRWSFRVSVLMLTIMAVLAWLFVYGVFRNVSGVQLTLRVAGYASFLVSLLAPAALVRRWSKANAELALLALLPGFGSARGAQQALLRAVFGVPAKRLGILLLVLWVAIAWGPLGFAATLLAALAQLGWFGLLAATLPGVLGGQPPRVWTQLLLWGWMGVLVVGSFWLVGGDADVADLRLVLEAGWVLLGIVLLLLGIRGWRALRRQPHVFLAL